MTGLQAVEEERDRGDLVRLLRDRLLTEDQLLGGREGGDEMQRCFASGAVVAATRRLAVESDEGGRVVAQLAGPIHEAGREQRGIETVHQDVEPAPAGHAVVKGQKTAQKIEMRLAPGGDVIEIIARGDRRAHHQQQHFGQRMGHTPWLARVFNDRKMIQQVGKTRRAEGGLHNGDSKSFVQSRIRITLPRIR